MDRFDAKDDSLEERKSARRMRKVYRKLVRGKSSMPRYFRGGKNVGTVRRRNVGGKVGSAEAY